MKTMLDDDFSCPDSRRSWYCDVALCNLNDKICLLESGDKCPYYEEWLEEQNTLRPSWNLVDKS